MIDPSQTNITNIDKLTLITKSKAEDAVRCSLSPSNVFIKHLQIKRRPGCQRKHNDVRHVNDSLYEEQWYLRVTDELHMYIYENECTPLTVCVQKTPSNFDLHIQEAWAAKLSGKGISVAVVDNGVEEEHIDLKENFVCMKFKN